jgi:hypothetical protein
MVNMLSTTILAISALAGSAAAHYKLLEPVWRGDSFEEPASQWTFPCKYLHTESSSTPYIVTTSLYHL